MAAGNQKEIGERRLTAKLGAMLSEAFVDAVFARQKVTAVHVAAVGVFRGESDAIHVREERFALNGEGTPDRGKFHVARRIAARGDAKAVDDERPFVNLRPGSESHQV